MSEEQGSETVKDNNKDNEMTIDTRVIDESSIDENDHGDQRVEKTGDDQRTRSIEEMINCVINSKAIFKSQQKDDPDLTAEEKAKIASDLFTRNPSMFLSRFGRFIREEHLRYFDDVRKHDYEIMFHVNRLRRYHNYSQRQIDVKNRRYQALKSLVDKGDYFSETEMMRRNPLLYEHLIGQYLTEEQKKARDNIDTQNITFVNLLLESIQRDGTRNLKKEQQEAEDDVMEENESDDDSDESIGSEATSCRRKDKWKMKTDVRWGEMPGEQSSSTLYEKEENEKRTECLWREISSKERQVLRDEFITNMYHSFLNGRDEDFDYSTVDDDESYDNVDLRSQDEEEKYFDSESPETIEEEKMEEDDQSSEEDELDKYMRTLQEPPTPDELADEVQKQTIR